MAVMVLAFPVMPNCKHLVHAAQDCTKLTTIAQFLKAGHPKNIWAAFLLRGSHGNQPGDNRPSSDVNP
jgi:hypothetical protein